MRISRPSSSCCGGSRKAEIYCASAEFVSELASERAASRRRSLLPRSGAQVNGSSGIEQQLLTAGFRNDAPPVHLLIGAPFDPGIPYVSAKKQAGVATFSILHVGALMAEVSGQALRACWYQKWFSHRRVARPPALASPSPSLDEIRRCIGGESLLAKACQARSTTIHSGQTVGPKSWSG